MSDNRNTEVQEKPVESKGQESAEARSESQKGMEALSAENKDYMQARKDGLRDKHTAEIFGAQPEFFDSSAAVSKLDGGGAKGDSVQKDKDGYPTKVEYPGGASSEIKYNDRHQPVEIKDQDNNTWKKGDNGWDRFDKNGKKTQHLDGTMDVDSHGNITVKEQTGYSETANADGSFDKRFPDRTGVFENKDGQVYSVLHKDGGNTFVEYDDKGNPSKFREVDQNGNETGSWVKDGDRWSIRDKKGEEVGYFNGDVKVDSEGNVTRTGYDSRSGEKEVQTVRRDGTTSREMPDKSVIETDRDGKLTHVKYPDGKTADMQYDEKGELKQFKDKDGTLHKLDHGKWSAYTVEKDGTETFKHDEEGFYKAKPNGDIERNSKDQRTADTQHANGTKDRLEFWDPEHKELTKQVTWDEKGRMTSATYPGESVSQDQVKFLRYDKNGQLESIADAHPSERGMTAGHWSKNKDGTWTKYDKNGDVELNGDGSRKEAKSITVGPDGEIVITNKDGTKDPPITRRKF